MCQLFSLGHARGGERHRVADRQRDEPLDAVGRDRGEGPGERGAEVVTDHDGLGEAEVIHEAEHITGGEEQVAPRSPDRREGLSTEPAEVGRDDPVAHPRQRRHLVAPEVGRVGKPCSTTTGGPEPSSTYATSTSPTCTRSSCLSLIAGTRGSLRSPVPRRSGSGSSARASSPATTRRCSAPRASRSNARASTTSIGRGPPRSRRPRAASRRRRRTRCSTGATRSTSARGRRSTGVSSRPLVRGASPSSARSPCRSTSPARRRWPRRLPMPA